MTLPELYENIQVYPVAAAAAGAVIFTIETLKAKKCALDQQQVAV